MKRIALLTLLFALCHSPLFAQQIRPEVQAIIDKIAAVDVLAWGSWGANRPRKEWMKQENRFYDLEMIATTNELRALAHHPNAVVRAYAFCGLVHKGDSTVFPILLRTVCDTSSVQMVRGCHYRTTQFLLDEMLGYLIYNNTTTPTRRYWTWSPDSLSATLTCSAYAGRHRFTDSQRDSIAELLLYCPIDYEYKEWLVFNLKPELRYYQRLRELVEEEHYWAALLPLARYRNQADIPFIQMALATDSLRRDGWIAVREFPAAAFLSTLHRNLFDLIERRDDSDSDPFQSDLSPFYAALVQIKSEESIELIEHALKNAHESSLHRDAIREALEKYPDPFFQSILPLLR